MPQGSHKSWQRPLIRSLKRWATNTFPVPFPVRVYLRPRRLMEQCHGYWKWSETTRGGVIAICDDLTRQELIDTFLEEYAHARTAVLYEEGDEDDDDPGHHATFWSELGRITKRWRADWA